MENPVLDCIYTRRSVRDYLDKPVPEETINEILKAASMAPSAMNFQPWRFSVVEGRENIRHFGEIALKQYNLLGWALKLHLTLKNAESIFFNAPLLIIVSGKRGYMWLKDDINLAVENMFLAAHSLGLGSCWIGFGKTLDNDKEARKELGVPSDFEIVAPLIFGYPKKENKIIPKREVKILKWIR